MISGQGPQERTRVEDRNLGVLGAEGMPPASVYKQEEEKRQQREGNLAEANF